MVTRERAQLLLVTAVVVSLAIVASVTLLNSIYSAGATQSGSIESDTAAVEQSHDELRHGLEELFVRQGDFRVTTTGSNYTVDEPLPFLDSTASPSISHFQRNLSENLVPLYARTVAENSGAVVSVELNRSRSVNGTAIVQQNDSTFVRPSDGAADWDLAGNLDGVVRTQMEIDPRPSETLSVYAENTTTGERWWLNVSDSWVRVNPHDGPPRDICRLSSLTTTATTHIDVVRTTGTVTVRTDEDIPCGRFTLAPGVTRPFTVGFVNGDGATGNYIVTHPPGTAISSWSRFAGQPDEVTGLVNPAFDMTYVSSTVRYRSQFALYNRTAP